MSPVQVLIQMAYIKACWNKGTVYTSSSRAQMGRALSAREDEGKEI